MIAHPVIKGLKPCNFAIAADGVIDLLATDEAQDACMAQSLFIESMGSPITRRLTVYDRLQRIYSFADASPEALETLTCNADLTFELLNNFRSVQQICSEIENTLLVHCNVERRIICTTDTDGVVESNRDLSNIEEVKSYLCEGSIVFICRLMAPLLELLHVRLSRLAR